MAKKNKGGRPVLTNPRQVQIQIRVNREEFDLLSSAALAADRPISQWIRVVSVAEAMKPRK